MRNLISFFFIIFTSYLVVACGISNTDEPESANSFVITSDSSNWVIASNGIPLHSLDQNSYTNTYKAQTYYLAITKNPSAISTTQLDTQFPKAFGITLDGVKLDPLTAECYDNSGNRSNHNSCTYRLDALQTIQDLGFDNYFGHVQPNSGAYHYHAYSENAAREVYKSFTGSYPDSSADLILIGLARDGFPIYYSLKNTETSNYALNSTPRDAFIGGTTPNGLYVSDYSYSASNGGTLDECNGKTITGSPNDYANAASTKVDIEDSINYIYVVTPRFKTDGSTPNFPAIPHCFKGSLYTSDGF